MRGRGGSRRSLPSGPRRSKMGGAVRGRRRDEPTHEGPPRLRNAHADHMLKSSRKHEEKHPSLQRVGKGLRSKLYQLAFDKDRKTPGEVKH